ncbi:MAG: CehA/McbA family metallohydrolase [Candidatus Latescibacterota bacterium]
MEWEPLFDVGCITGKAMEITEESIEERFPRPERMHRYKGGLHVHTTESDGDASPADVARWYKRHGFHFIVITDHNKVTPVEDLNREFGKDGTFLVLHGEEVTDTYPAPEGEGAVHVNAIGITASIRPRGGLNGVAVLSNDIQAIREAGGLPMVNHPNFRWSLTADDLYPVSGWSLLEFANRGSAVNILGFDRPDPEEIWDDLLSRGRLLYGTASDNAHHFTSFSPRHDNPGRGWIMTQCDSLNAKSVMDALAQGRFYPTTGIIFEEMDLTPDRVRVTVQKWDHERHRIEFIGLGGSILQTVFERTAEYNPNGAEGYVRVRVTDSNGLRGWTQPVILGR